LIEASGIVCFTDLFLFRGECIQQNSHRRLQIEFILITAAEGVSLVLFLMISEAVIYVEWSIIFYIIGHVIFYVLAV